MTDIRPSIRILHLEDSPLDAELVRARLAAGGLACDIVLANGRDRFEATLESGPFDLILCDYSLPGYDGISALRQARERQPDAPVIVLSGLLGEEEAVKCLHLGATDYLLKERLERLVPAVERALAEAEGHRQRQQSEAALRQSEARFRQLVQLLPTAVYVCDKSGVIREHNRAAVTLWGREPRPAERFFDSFRIHRADGTRLPRGHCPMAETLRTGTPVSNEEVVFQRPDGLRVPVIANTTPLTDAQGELVGAINCLVDITQRKRAEEEIRARARQQAAVAELGRAALRGVSLAELREMAVTVVAEVFGVEYCNVLELLPDDSTLRLVAGVGWKEGLVGSATVEIERDSPAGYSLLAQETVIMEDLRTETHSLAPRLLRDHGVISGISVPIPGDKGPWGALGAHSAHPRAFTPDDVSFLQSVANVIAEASQREHAEQTIRQSEMLLRVAGRTARMGGWSVDLARNRVLLSDVACAIHEIPAGTSFAVDEGIGFYAPEYQARMEEVLDACAREGTPYDEELEIVTARGRRVWVRTIGEAVHDGNGAITHVRGSFQDITDRKQAEQQVQRLASRLTTTLESITDGFYTLDRQWRFTYLNREAERVLQRARDDLLGKVVWEEFKEAVGSVFDREYRRALAQNTSVGFEAHYPRLDCWVEVRAYPSEEGLAVYFRDITERKRAEEQVEFLALYDPLTRLPNRQLLMDRLQHALTTSVHRHRLGALVFIDLDDFKALNDTLGHKKGDCLLQQVASRLSACLREGDTVARFGGDEFVVVLEELGTTPDTAAVQARVQTEKILAALHEPYRLGDETRHSTASIGVALLDEHSSTAEELMKRVDLAMYQAKAAGGDTLRFFDPGMQHAIDARVRLEGELRIALERREFVLHYQPQVDRRARPRGAEALVRWQHPERGLIHPDEFIPLAEVTGLILPLGRYLLHDACTQLAAWAGQPETARLELSVNVSSRQFHHPSFVDDVLAVLDHTGADPARLKLELTESMLLENVEDTVAKMNALRANGVSFSLDDFGTGASSLYYLKRLPLSELKIDHHFVQEVLTDPNDAAIVRAVIVLARSLGLKLIAEGVETEGVRDFLAAHGCPAYQGYLFGRPQPANELEVFVRRRGLASGA